MIEYQHAWLEYKYVLKMVAGLDMKSHLANSIVICCFENELYVD